MQALRKASGGAAALEGALSSISKQCLQATGFPVAETNTYCRNATLGANRCSWKQGQGALSTAHSSIDVYTHTGVCTHTQVSGSPQASTLLTTPTNNTQELVFISGRPLSHLRPKASCKGQSRGTLLGPEHRGADKTGLEYI